MPSAETHRMRISFLEASEHRPASNPFGLFFGFVDGRVVMAQASIASDELAEAGKPPRDVWGRHFFVYQ